MPRYLIKLIDEKDNNKSYYLEWSTIVDAPVTFGMSLEDFAKYYQEEYGRHGMLDFEQRVRRLEEKGTTCPHDKNVDETISGNRAGKNETELTKEEIIDWYCRKKEEPK